MLRKTLLSAVFLCIPSLCFAQLEFFSSPSNTAVYDPSIWSSHNSPDPQSDMLFIHYHSEPLPVAEEYQLAYMLWEETITESVQKQLISRIETSTQSQDDIVSYSSEIIENFISFEDQQFVEYVITAISEDTQKNIEHKLEENIVLSPYEETLYSCDISLEDRREIVADILLQIQNGEIQDTSSIEYSDPRFGDCVIPYPDIRHRETLIEDSFVSNQLQTESMQESMQRLVIHESIVQESSQDIEAQILYLELTDTLEELKNSGRMDYSGYQSYHQTQEIYESASVSGVEDTEVSQLFHSYLRLVSEYVDSMQNQTLGEEEFTEFLYSSEDIALLIEKNIAESSQEEALLELRTRIRSTQEYYQSLLSFLQDDTSSEKLLDHYQDSREKIYKSYIRNLERQGYPSSYEASQDSGYGGVRIWIFSLGLLFLIAGGIYVLYRCILGGSIRHIRPKDISVYIKHIFTGKGKR